MTFTPPLLGPDDPPPYIVANAEGRASFLLVCDHAGHAIPAKLGDLGLPEAERLRHIGWDPGAAAVTRILSARFDAPAVLGVYSRLVVDLNRDLDSPTLIAPESDGTIVPANREIPEAERQARLDEIFDPYHKAVASVLAGIPGTPGLISIHSFTPQLRGGPHRPWEIGVLWGEDGRLASPLLDALNARGDLTVGDNQPYSDRSGRGTVGRHARPLGLRGVSIELRQDLIGDEAGAARWAGILGDALGPILEAANLLPKP